MLRVPPDVHRAALAAAQKNGQSLNQWATQTLQQAATGTFASC
jgi:predicted HicB family RNase H-like nuclease